MKQLSNFKLLFLTFLSFTLIMCSSDNNNESEEEIDIPMDTDFSDDTINKNLTITDIYFQTGPNALQIQMDNKDADNPGQDKIPVNGTSLLSDDVGANHSDAVFISITGQVLNSEGKTLDYPINNDFEYVIVSIINPDNVPNNVLPNARIEKISDVTFTPNGQQGQDVFTNTIVDITGGKFKLIALEAGVLGLTSSGESVTSIEFAYDSGAFTSYFADGAIVAKNSGGFLDTPTIIENIFNQNSTEVFIVENLNSSPNLSELQITRPYLE